MSLQLRSEQLAASNPSIGQFFVRIKKFSQTLRNVFLKKPPRFLETITPSDCKEKCSLKPVGPIFPN